MEVAAAAGSRVRRPRPRCGRQPRKEEEAGGDLDFLLVFCLEIRLYSYFFYKKRYCSHFVPVGVGVDPALLLFGLAAVGVPPPPSLLLLLSGGVAAAAKTDMSGMLKMEEEEEEDGEDGSWFSGGGGDGCCCCCCCCCWMF